MKVLIIGGGQVGSHVANILLKSGCDVIIIDHRSEILEKLENELDHSVVISGNGSEPEILEKAGIANCDAIAVVTDSDETNLVISTIAKYEFGVPRVIARVNRPRNAWLFNLEMGVDVKVNQADLVARLVVDEIDMKNIMTLMKLNRGDYSIVQVSVANTSSIVHSTVEHLKLPDRTVLIAIERNHEMIIPNGATTIEANDDIIIMTDEAGQIIANELFN